MIPDCCARGRKRATTYRRQPLLNRFCSSRLLPGSALDMDSLCYSTLLIITAHFAVNIRSVQSDNPLINPPRLVGVQTSALAINTGPEGAFIPGVPHPSVSRKQLFSTISTLKNLFALNAWIQRYEVLAVLVQPIYFTFCRV